MNSKYIRDFILISIYTFILISQLSFSSYIINNKDNLEIILENYKNITECKNDAIYRLNNGTMINNTTAILISSCIIIGSFLLILINYYISQKYQYEILDNNFEKNNSLISRRLIPREKYDLAIHLIFIMSIICFIVCNGIQFILQLNNISQQCVKYIDYKLTNFYVIYNFMTCTSFIASYALFCIVPCFI
jgi:hypothetical protein